jgi:hypothetical protein
MLWYTCLIKHAETLLRTKDYCTHFTCVRILAVRLVLLTEGSFPVLSVNCDYFNWRSTEHELRNPWNQSHNFLRQNTCLIGNDVSNSYPIGAFVLVVTVTVSPSRCPTTVRGRKCGYTYWREDLWSTTARGAVVPEWAAKLHEDYFRYPKVDKA